MEPERIWVAALIVGAGIGILVLVLFVAIPALVCTPESQARSCLIMVRKING